MITVPQLFSTDPGQITDFSQLRPAEIFNRSIMPRVSSFAAEEEDPGGLDAAKRRREAQLQKDLSMESLSQKADNDFLEQLNRGMEQRQAAPQADVEDYNAPIGRSVTPGAVPQAEPGDTSKPSAVVGDFSKENLKLSNYGYASDSSPDYNSNVLRIGHANNKLVDGYSAALTKSLAKRYGLKSGDEFEVITADGKVLKRRYDDTVPATYRGKPLPETVDLYDRSGNNNFGGKIVGIRPLGKPASKEDARKLTLPGSNGDISEYDNPILPPRN